MSVCFAFITSAKVVTTYYGPNHNGKYLEIIFNGDEAIACVHDSVSRYSHSRVEDMLKAPHLWRIKFVRFNESDSTLVFHNTFHQPIRLQYILPNDLSTLEIKDLRQDADLPGEKLPLVNIHIDPRSGNADYIGKRGLTIRTALGKE